MFNINKSENSHGVGKITILSFLILFFLAITLLILNNNVFILNLDQAVHTLITSHLSPSFYSWMLSITNIGDILSTIIIFTVFGLFLFSKNKTSFYIFTLATASGIASTQIIKHFVQRARPINPLEQGFSFPSAHAMIATVFLLSSIYLLAPHMKKVFSKNTFLIVTAIIFPLVAFSRIYLSVHWASDVIAGIVLGLICFVFSSFTYCYKKENVL